MFLQQRKGLSGGLRWENEGQEDRKKEKVVRPAEENRNLGEGITHYYFKV